MAPMLVEESFFPVEDGSDSEVDKVIGGEDEAAVKAGTPGDMEKVDEGAVDEDGGDVEDEVWDFSVLVDEDVVVCKEVWRVIGFLRSADPLTKKRPRFCWQHGSPMVPLPQQKLPSLHEVTVNVLAVRSKSLPAWYCPFVSD